MSASAISRIAAGLGVAILLWKDSLPGTQFPPLEELVKIELGRVLSQPDVLEKHGYRPSPHVAMALASPPWSAPNPKELLAAYIDDVKIVGANFDALAEDLFRCAHEHKNTYVPPPKVYRDLDKRSSYVLSKGIGKLLGMPASDITVAQDLIKTRYDELHKLVGLNFG